jgi:Fe-S cluster assembly ATP-binding protein
MAWQEPARFDGLTVRQFLQLGGTEDSPAAHLLRVGLDPERYLARALDKTLSGGERKRVELASLLAMRPRLAILDEPTSGIDLLSLGEMAAVIRSLRNENSSVLLITHQEEIARIADRASYLCAGRLLMTDVPSVVAARFRRRPCGESCNGETCQ